MRDAGLSMLLLAIAASCALVVLTPGPGVLMALHLGAGSGRRSAAYFLLGHLIGDLLWALLALIALRWIQLLPPAFFVCLTVASAAYLIWLGVRALASTSGKGATATAPARQPAVHGVLFGLTNPKSYPVTLAIFAAVIAGDVDTLTVHTVPLFLAAGCLGFVAADVTLAWLVGLRAVRKLYRTSAPWIIRGVAVVFFGFAGYSLAQVSGVLS